MSLKRTVNFNGEKVLLKLDPSGSEIIISGDSYDNPTKMVECFSNWECNCDTCWRCQDCHMNLISWISPDGASPDELHSYICDQCHRRRKFYGFVKNYHPVIRNLRNNLRAIWRDRQALMDIIAYIYAVQMIIRKDIYHALNPQQVYLKHLVALAAFRRYGVHLMDMALARKSIPGFGEKSKAAILQMEKQQEIADRKLRRPYKLRQKRLLKLKYQKQEKKEEKEQEKVKKLEQEQEKVKKLEQKLYVHAKFHFVAPNWDSIVPPPDL